MSETITAVASLGAGNRTLATNVDDSVAAYFDRHHWEKHVSKAALVRAILLDYALRHGYTLPVAPTSDGAADGQ